MILEKQSVLEINSSQKQETEEHKKMLLPWLWQSFFAKVNPNPLSYMSVYFHKAVHSRISNLGGRSENIKIPFI